MELIIIFLKTCPWCGNISDIHFWTKPNSWKTMESHGKTAGKLRKSMKKPWKNPWKSASPKQPSEHLPIGTRPLLPRRARPRPSKPPCSWCRHLRPWCPPAWELGPKFMATSMGNHGNIWQNHETSKKFGVKIVKYLCFTQNRVKGVWDLNSIWLITVLKCQRWAFLQVMMRVARYLCPSSPWALLLKWYDRIHSPSKT